tara:strand:- start:135 stop:386 length:252 start_codon:yes stop_codon:yes gene_type:complete
MKLKIETVEEVAGHTLRSGWKKPMYLVNDFYVASTIKQHNINKQSFDLSAGEEVEVFVKPDHKYPNTFWVVRNNQNRIKGTNK